MRCPKIYAAYFAKAPAWSVSLSYTVAESMGPSVMGGAMDALIRMQHSSIKDLMKYNSIQQ